MFGLRLVVPCGTHRLFGNRHHPQTRRIIRLAEKMSTIFCDAFDKKRADRASFDRPVSTPLYSAFCSRERVYGQVAQLVEHATENRGVGGSTPSLAINKVNDMRASFTAPVFRWCTSRATAPQDRPPTLPLSNFAASSAGTMCRRCRSRRWEGVPVLDAKTRSSCR